MIVNVLSFIALVMFAFTPAVPAMTTVAFSDAGEDVQSHVVVDDGADGDVVIIRGAVPHVVTPHVTPHVSGGHVSGHSSGGAHDSAGHSVRGGDGVGHGEGSDLHENGVTKDNPDGDGTGTYTDTHGLTVPYRPVAHGSKGGAYECDADHDGKYQQSECTDMPETSRERRAENRSVVILLFSLAGVFAFCLSVLFVKGN